MTEKINTISEEKVDNNDLDYLVREYLVHSGYQESFMAFDRENSPIIVDENYNDLSWKKNISAYDVSAENMFIEKKTSAQMEVDDLPYDIDKLRKYSQDEGMLREPEMRKRTLSIVMERMNGKYIFDRIFF